jgi:hypothetical protein
MVYTVEKIQTLSDCQVIIDLANVKHASLTTRIANVQAQIVNLLNGAATLPSDIQETQYKLDGVNAKLSLLPEGTVKEEHITRKIGLEYKLRLLNGKFNDYGAVAELQTNNELDRFQAELERQNDYISQLEARKVALGD